MAFNDAKRILGQTGTGQDAAINKWRLEQEETVGQSNLKKFRKEHKLETIIRAERVTIQNHNKELSDDELDSDDLAMLEDDELNGLAREMIQDRSFKAIAQAKLDAIDVQLVAEGE